MLEIQEVQVTNECPECGGMLLRDGTGVEYVSLSSGAFVCDGVGPACPDPDCIMPIYCADCEGKVDSEASKLAGYIILKPEGD